MRPSRFRLPVSLLLLATVMVGRLAAGDGPASLAVPLDRPSAATEAAARAVESALADALAAADGQPTNFVTPDGVYVLHGDLFNSGERVALLGTNHPPASDEPEKAPGVALARWDGHRWELRGLWSIFPEWRPKAWVRNDRDDPWVRPAEAPFTLEDLSGDGVPEVIVAGGIDKHYQAHHLLRFDPATRRLDLVAEAMARPVAVGGYVRLYFNSGRRAEWVKWCFLSWRNGHLVERASWRDETPYDEPDRSFRLVTRQEVPGTRPMRFRVEWDYTSDEDGAYRVTRNGRPFARVTFHWPERPAVAEDAENRFFFARLTGLPAAFYPVVRDGDVPALVTDAPRVTVTGRPAAVRLLSNPLPR